MKKKTKHAKEALEREEYLTTDFANALAGLKPLDLDLEFPSPTQAINIRLPRDVLIQIRILADERDIPYQSLIKMWLAEHVRSGV